MSVTSPPYPIPARRFARRLLSLPAAVLVALAVLAILLLGAGGPWPFGIGAGPSSTTLVVENDAFAPTAATVESGSAVVWEFRESGHNAVSYEGPAAFDSRGSGSTNPSGSTYTTTLTKTGVYKYLCTEHGKMLASITVVPASGNSGPGGGGSGSNSGPGSGNSGPGSGESPSAPAAGAAPAARPAPGTGAVAAHPATETTAPSVGQPTVGTVDASRPTLQRLGFRANVLRLSLSTDERLVIRFRRAGSRKGATRTVQAAKGTVRLRLRRWMRPGRYRVSITGLDRAGNASAVLRTSVTIR